MKSRSVSLTREQLGTLATLNAIIIQGVRL